MLELESKYKVAPSAYEKITDLGYKKTKESQQKDTYYLIETKPSGEQHYLRIREKEGKVASFDYHIALSDFETKEFETGVEKPEILREILELMGRKEVCIIDKKREIFDVGKIAIIFDTVEKLGTFIEVEANGDEVTLEELQAFAESLGLTEENRVKNAGYPDLMVEAMS